jgi:hypothetical protein
VNAGSANGRTSLTIGIGSILRYQHQQVEVCAHSSWRRSTRCGLFAERSWCSRNTSRLPPSPRFALSANFHCSDCKQLESMHMCKRWGYHVYLIAAPSKLRSMYGGVKLFWGSPPAKARFPAELVAQDGCESSTDKLREAGANHDRRQPWLWAARDDNYFSVTLERKRCFSSCMPTMPNFSNSSTTSLQVEAATTCCNLFASPRPLNALSQPSELMTYHSYAYRYNFRALT